MVAEGKQFKAMDEIYKRSSSHLMPVRQMEEVFKERGYQSSDSKREFAFKRGKCVASSQACVDAFKRQAAQQARQVNSVGKPERAMSILLDKKVFSVVHKFDEVQSLDGGLGRGLVLPPEAFRAGAGHTRLNMAGSASTSDVTEWYSCSAPPVPCQHADRALLDAPARAPSGSHRTF